MAAPADLSEVFVNRKRKRSKFWNSFFLQKFIMDIYWLWLQEKRITATDALAHPYLDEGRLRYHSCMCKCCHTTPAGRQYTPDFEPVATHPFSYAFEDELTSTTKVKGIPMSKVHLI